MSLLKHLILFPKSYIFSTKYRTKYPKQRTYSGQKVPNSVF